MRRIRRLVSVASSLLLGAALAASLPAAAVDNLIDHNGLVLTNPRLFIVYWGTAWQSGFNDSVSGLPSSSYRSYLEDFLNGVGGGAWLATQAQYRGAHSPQGVVAGTWVDANNALPATPTQGQIEEEVRRAAEHFNTSSDPQAVYLISLAPGHADAAEVAKGGSACAWHTSAWNNNFINSRNYPYITLPYMPDQGGGCAPNLVNQGFDFSGHGIFDGVSKSGGHEWAEALTDPLIDAWFDIKGSENADKCQFPRNNIRVGNEYYAVQALWSNADGGCVLAGVPTADQSPGNYDFGPVVRYTSSTPLTVQLVNNGNLDLPLILIKGSPWYLTGTNPQDFALSNQTCQKVLHPGASCSVDVLFRPLALGARQVTLAVNVQQGVPHTGTSTPLVGDGIPQWAVFDQNIVAFPFARILSSDSAPRSVNLSNQGPASRSIQRVEVGGDDASDFTILSDLCSDRILPPSVSCTITLGFVPTATGDRDAELQITDGSGEVGIPIEGGGLGPIAAFSADEVVFDEVQYDPSGATPGGGIPVTGEVLRPLTLTNVGAYPLHVNAAEVTGDFALDSNSCTQPLQPNESCTLQARMAPVHFADQTGHLRVYDDTSDSPHDLLLSGTVEAPIASLVLDSLDFGTVRMGRTSGPQTVELENLEGDVPLHIQSISASGDFSATSNCPAELAIGRCTITVLMSPAHLGYVFGSLQVVDDAPNSPQRIPLTGYGGGVSCGIGAELSIVVPLLRRAWRRRRSVLSIGS